MKWFSPSSHITISALRNENPGISSAFVIGWLWAKSVDSRFIFSEDCLRREIYRSHNPRAALSR